MTDPVPNPAIADLTLLDLVAAAVITGILASRDFTDSADQAEWVAERAYAMGEAFLRARARRA